MHLAQSPSTCFMAVKGPGCYKITMVFSHTQLFFVSAAPLSPASPREAKQGSQKDAPPKGSSINSTLNQDKWETFPRNTFWVQKKRERERDSVSVSVRCRNTPVNNAALCLQGENNLQRKDRFSYTKNDEQVGKM